MNVRRRGVRRPELVIEMHAARRKLNRHVPGMAHRQCRNVLDAVTDRREVRFQQLALMCFDQHNVEQAVSAVGGRRELEVGAGGTKVQELEEQIRDGYALAIEVEFAVDSA